MISALTLGILCLLWRSTSTYDDINKLFDIQEEIPIGHPLGNMAELFNVAGRPEKMRIINTDDTGVDCFSVEGPEGTLTVVKRLDREAICPKLKEEDPARLGGGISQIGCSIQLLIASSSTHNLARVRVNIEDINDNKPYWDRPRIRVVFRDGDEVGSKRQLPLAFDADAGRNGIVQYELIGDKGSFILVHQDGLYLQALLPIDREKKANYSMTLVARDQGRPAQTLEVKVLVVVEDINDNAPVFTRTKFRNQHPIPETVPVGSTVLNLNASDRDEGMNGKFHFDFSPLERSSVKRYFRVNRNGAIVVARPLDFDKGSSEFQFKVIVQDEAVGAYALSSEAVVHLTLSDENDEKPIPSLRYLLAIDPKTRYHTIPENQESNDLIAMLQVRDPDYGGTDTVDCDLSNKNFTLVQGERTNEYKLFTATRFDRETTPFQRLTITCRDKAFHSTTLNVTIKIGDVNDNAPKFERTLFNLNLAENAPPGTRLRGLLMANDADEGLNARIEYRIAQEHAANFSVDSRTGVVQTRPGVSFDREAAASYRVKVLAVDGGEPQLTGTGTAQVMILDVNDNPPKFSREVYSLRVMEERPKGTRVGAVLAIDADENASVRYSLGPESPDASYFIVDETSGAILTRRKLDRETRPHFTFTVLARDGGLGRGHTSTASVNVIVDDENDNAPVFKRPNATYNTFQVEGTKTLGHKLDYIRAEDADADDNARLAYSIVSGNTEGLFNLDSRSGLLFLDNSLQSAARRPGAKSVYLITLKACDHGIPPRCSTFTNLRIMVTGGVGGAGAGDNGAGGGSGSGGQRGGGNEPILICLSVIFVILVVATGVLFLLLRKKSFWTGRTNRKAAAGQQGGSGKFLSGNGGGAGAASVMLSGDPGYHKTDGGSNDMLAGGGGNPEDETFLRMKMGKCVTLDRRFQRERHPQDICADYQTLDSLCLASTAARYAICDPSLMEGHPQHQQQQQQHTYYEISMPTGAGGDMPPPGSAIIGGGGGGGPVRPFPLQMPMPDLNLYNPEHLSDRTEAEGGPVANATANRKLAYKHQQQQEGKQLYAPQKYSYAAYREASFV